MVAMGVLRDRRIAERSWPFRPFALSPATAASILKPSYVRPTFAHEPRRASRGTRTPSGFSLLTVAASLKVIMASPWRAPSNATSALVPHPNLTARRG